MLNKSVKSDENLTPSVINRPIESDHNLDATHRTHIDAANFASLSAAVDACGAAGSKLCNIVLSENHVFGSDKTVETHITFMPRRGGKITIETGVTITMKGSVDAPPVQWIVLEGTGIINFSNRFIEKLLPQWWGAKADGVTDDDDAINDAITAAGGNLPVYLPTGNYLFDETIAIDNQADKLIGNGPELTILTRKTGATGEAILFGASGTKAVLEGFTLDCDYEGTDGINTAAAAWAGKMADVTVLDCEAVAFNSPANDDAVMINCLSNNRAGGTPNHQFLLGGKTTGVGIKMLSAVIPATANLEFSGNNVSILGCRLSGSLHLTDAVRWNGGDNNNITGLNFVTEDNTKTYTQLLHFESGSIENIVRDVHIEKGATDTITNSVVDDENSRTISFLTTFNRYAQTEEGIVKGWIEFNGIGTVIFDSFNVSSLTDTGTGDWTVVWDIDFANDDYAVALGIQGRSGVNATKIRYDLKAAGSVGILAFDDADNANDTDKVSVIAIGN